MNKRLAIPVLQYVWSSPTGLCGLLVEFAFRALGWVHFRSGRQQTICGPLADLMHRRGWRGMTIGWSRFYWHTPVVRTVYHEERHVQHALWFGPLLPLAYLACVLGGGYRGCWFERDARAYADRKMALDEWAAVQTELYKWEG